jgi:hypothetical protein
MCVLTGAFVAPTNGAQGSAEARAVTMAKAIERLPITLWVWPRDLLEVAKGAGWRPDADT